MSKPKPTPVLLVCRSQAWFRASVVMETLGAFNTQALDQFPVPNPNGINLRSWIGKGPCAYDIGASATLYFDHGEEAYPVFTCPSVSPKGSSAYTTPLMRRLVADEQTAIFCLEAATSTPVAPELFDKAPGLLNDSENRFIMDNLNTTRTVVHSLVGIYALYQYPLVWGYMDERHQWSLIDVITRQGKPAFEAPPVDNWFPFRLDVCTKINSDGLLRDGISHHFAELVAKFAKDESRQPFIFLKDSMCHTDIRTRFLLQYWILEYFADKYTETLPHDQAIQTFAQDLEKIVKEKFPSFADYFKSRKGELTRLTLLQKIRACFQAMRIQYNEGHLKKAKSIRDGLSHATKVSEDDLREMELYLRELVRHMIRRDLELQGIFLDGEERSQDALPEIVPSYPDPSRRLTKAFGPLEAS